MKKLLLITLAIVMMACSTEEEQQSQNCNCDRVVEVNTFNVVGTPQNPAISYYSVYYTINDCSGVQKQKSHTTTNISEVPALGQCR